jgi:hypothetical protein
MVALAVLGKVLIPDEITALLPSAYDSWPRAQRSVWEIHEQRWYQPTLGDRPYLSAETVSFVDTTLSNFGINEWEPETHSLLLFEDGEAHRDDGVTCNGRQGAFFHLVLEGSGILHLPGVGDKGLRRLQLEKGLAFWFNPNVAHAVTQSSPNGIATLSATIRANPERT